MGASVIIGGKGFRWRGKSIRTVCKDSVTCVTMPRKDSMVMAPAVIIPGAQYQVTIIASRNSGNGALLVNFFGGKHYDGAHMPINIISADMRKYTISVIAPKSPKNIPMYLRVWRPNNASGNVFIKTIVFKFIAGGVKIAKQEPESIIHTRGGIRRLNRDKPPRATKNKKERTPAITKLKENKEMKYKPYGGTSGKSAVDKVLIRKPEDVPKVSIITPTRDGLELLKKCYQALDKNTCYPNWEWIIGDSSRSTGTAKYIKELKDPRVKLVERGTTDGSFSSINNELADFATGEYFLFLNDSGSFTILIRNNADDTTLATLATDGTLEVWLGVDSGSTPTWYFV